MKSFSDSEYELLIVKSIDSSGYGFPSTVCELKRRPLYGVKLAAKNSRQGIFSGQGLFGFMKSIDSSRFGLPIICSKHNYKQEADLL